MQDGVTGDEHPESPGSGGNDAPATVDGNADVDGNSEMPSGARATDTSKRKTLVIGGLAAAAVAFTAIGFGAASLIRNHVDTADAAAIPTPPAANQLFVEDDDGTGADSQENILQSTVPGLVHITSARGSGTGVVLTPSGLVLTSAQVAAGHGTIVAKMLPSGHVYPATVVGSDAAHGLALVQLEGGSTFKPAAIGNSSDFAAGAAATSVSTSSTGKAFTLSIGNVVTMRSSAAVGGQTLTGLMQNSAQFISGQSVGGPLVNLSGQVVGIELAGSAHGANVTSYAVPINQALTIARQLKH
jgi:S1-C subfamily serine protease